MLAPMKVESGLATFDLTLVLEDLSNGLVANFEYRTDLFDETTIVRMAGHWQTLLEGIIAEPMQQVTRLPLLTVAEKRCLLEEWNATQGDYPHEQCVHELFEAQVQRTPNAVAVVFEGTQLTYQELNQKANQLAHHLRSQGVGPEVLVGLCMQRSLEMIVGMLGVLKAGGAYVPLDPSYPPERLAFVLQDSQMAVLLTQRSLLDRLSKVHSQVICLDTDWQAISQQSGGNPNFGEQAAFGICDLHFWVNRATQKRFSSSNSPSLLIVGLSYKSLSYLLPIASCNLFPLPSMLL